MVEINYLSYSQLNMYVRCPRQYFYRYVEKKIYPPKARLSQGRAFHFAHEDGFTRKMADHKGYKTSDLMILFAEYFDREVQNNEPIFEEGENHGKLLDEGVGAVSVYGKSKACHIYPKQVEMPFEIGFKNAPFTFKGYIDLIDVGSRLIDIKLRSRRFSEKEQETDLQLTSYFVGYREVFGTNPKEIAWDLTLTQKKIQYERVPVTRGEIDVKHFLLTVADVAKAIQTGIFYPNTTSFLCSKDWCGYYKICMKGGKD
jgi:CRISPR/Cas system-associated exonuclease Cas4 (RecB family)